MIGVLCNGKKETTANWLRERELQALPDFWVDYIRDGRCAIDTDHNMHFLGDSERWETTGDVRACQWCGKATQRLRHWTETVERQSWESVKTNTTEPLLPPTTTHTP
jgi:hypothetical protein